MNRSARVFLSLCFLVSLFCCSCDLFDRTPPKKFLRSQKELEELEIKKDNILNEFTWYDSLKNPTEEEEQKKLSLSEDLKTVNKNIDILFKRIPPISDKLSEEEKRKEIEKIKLKKTRL
jgi:hypothetical protein